ncbi:translocation/assembly module TamB [Pseudomonas sp. gcc21]|uniref:translocation/assembly module TamB domain-containing protein n=1 Tax=Pseudomonas sp. gcc21 TaxID=2726989 RepID=UPI001451B932|nr:translocation/assembly module TamB domain-containing protein [Pseudomonas sp. gcc21]QJD58307.1 translocation/assembly module TamB [Pseudomonas sp. gcc21]
MIWFITKIFLRGLLILALIPLVLALLLANDGVNRWLFKQVQAFEPRLQLTDVSGDLWGGWAVERLEWRDENLQVVIQDLATSWTFRCLGSGRLCVEFIDIASIHIDSQPAEEDEHATDQAIELPDIDLPLGLDLQRLSIGSIWMGAEEPLLTDIYLTAALVEQLLYIREFSGAGPQLSWKLDGEVRMADGWPLMIRTVADLPPVDGRELTADLRLSGSAEDLRIDLRTDGYINGRLTGRVAPLEPALPLTVEWQSEDFLALSTLPETLTLQALTVTAQGNLDSGYSIRGQGSLPGEGGEIALQLEALARATGISGLELQLRVADEPARRLALSGAASWEDELEAEVQAELDRFPWQWLYPQDIGEIVVEQLEVDASLQGMDFRSDLSASLSGVAGHSADIQMTVAGDPDRINVAPLVVTTSAGSANGELALDLTEGVAWDAQLLLQELDPGVFVADLPGSLNGPISSRGSLEDEQLELVADWELNGSLRDRELRLSGAVTKQDENWDFTDILLTQGENRIAGGGRWGEEIAADLDIDLRALESLWPGLSGQLAGDINAAGSLDAPRVNANIQGRRIGYEQLELRQLSLTGEVTFSEEMPGRLNLTADRMRNGETRLGDLDVQLQGNRAAHALDLTLERSVVDIRSRIEGSLVDDLWQGALVRGEIEASGLDWRLEGRAPIEYQLAEGQLALQAHCWTHESARLCFEGPQQLMPDRQLALTLDAFPLTSLEDFLPEDFSWSGTLNADVEFAQPAGEQPTAQARISSIDGMVSVTDMDQTVAFPYSRLELTSELDPQRARNNFVLQSEALGQLAIQADIQDPAGEQQLTGNYQLDGFKLDFVRPFLPNVEVVRGQLNGSGDLAGTLLAPEVAGVIDLEDGEISGPELPVSFEQLNARAEISGQSATLSGNWRSGEAGQGNINGQIAWAPELDLSLAITGNALPVTVEPYADLQVSPDLRISLADNRLQLLGQIAIPEGDITVRELPPQAVRLSPDAVVVGEQTAAEQAPLDIDASVQLIIGDQLRFSGFGLTGRLRGQIQVEETMTANGDLNILDGRYRGYGQRLRLRRAQLLFAGPISQPYLNIEAIREVDGVTAGLRLTGPAEQPQSEIFSEPAMAQEQALSYLILGRPLGSDGGDSNVLGQAALALGMAGSGPMAQSIAGSLGIKNFQLDTEGTGDATQVVAAGYLTDKLSLRYGVGVFEPASQVGIRYELTRRLYLEALSGFASSLDFFYRIDF